jgi:hypothetical protein
MITIYSQYGPEIFSFNAANVRAAVEVAVRRGADLSGADLGGADLGGADLRLADLRSADLGSADLRLANFGGADLSGADLRNANLRNANLRGANFGGANFGGADLRLANLRNANLRGANLSGADLRLANLSGATIAWSSHTLIAELLFCAAGADPSDLTTRRRRAFAGLVLISDDWCWETWERMVNWHAEEAAWALSVLRPYVREGDDAPEILRVDTSFTKEI